MKKIWMFCCGAFLVLLLVFLVLWNNKTFFHTTYEGRGGSQFFIPRFSYFQEECCMTAATFVSLRSKKVLEREIADYLEEFEKFQEESTYGYCKGDLFLQSYEVVDHGIYRSIHLIY